MSIRIKSVCLNQPSDSFLYISSFCPPYTAAAPPPKRESDSAAVFLESLIFLLVYYYPTLLLTIQEPFLPKYNNVCRGVSVNVTCWGGSKHLRETRASHIMWSIRHRQQTSTCPLFFISPKTIFKSIFCLCDTCGYPLHLCLIFHIFKK